MKNTIEQNNDQTYSMLDKDFDEISSELLQLLAKIGYAGIGKGKFYSAKKVFEGILAVRPKNDDAILANATALLFSGHIKDATDILFELVERDETNDLAKSFLALALSMVKEKTYSTELAKSVIESNRNKAAIDMAKGIIKEHNAQKENASPTPQELNAQQATKFNQNDNKS